MITECRKASHASKRIAKSVRRKLGDKTLRPYFCSTHNAWHLGHRPRVIRDGELSRQEVYGGD